MESSQPGFLARSALPDLLVALHRAGYRCVGPQLRDGAIVYEELYDVGALPRGVHEIQAPGAYRIEHSDSARCFSWANGPQALKPFTFAPREVLWRAARDADGLVRFQEDEQAAPRPIAVIGVRACDLAALALQDQHFLQGVICDAHYERRRHALLLIAVHCTHPAATCFCASTGDGPRVSNGADLVLAELDDGFLVEASSERGRTIAVQLPLTAATDAQREAAAQETAAAAQQARGLPSRDLRDALLSRLEHPRWEEVAARCLACGNCTAVCPTCFCHAEVEQAGLSGAASTHTREWDSCFTKGHSYIHGLTIRADRRTRYRQWLTHKLATWHDQYGRSGCVGCGRCITWCPVGIDITEEVAALCTPSP
jgi:ferredoxin